MKHYLSKVIAIALTLAMILSVTPITLVSAASPTDIQFKIATVEVVKGTTNEIIVPVTVEKIPQNFQLSGTAWEFLFDPNSLVFQTSTEYSAFAGQLIDEPNKDILIGKVDSNNGSNGKFRWCFLTTENYITPGDVAATDGSLLYLKFKLAENLPAGTYPITVQSYGNIKNGTSEYVNEDDIIANIDTYMIPGAIVVKEPVANENVRNGNGSAKITVSSSTFDFHLKYNVTIEPNTDYILSAWSKGSGSVILYSRLNGSWSGSEARTIALKVGENWKHNVMTFNSGAKANGSVVSYTTLCFALNGYDSKGSLYVDDLFLAKASDPTVNLIPDTGFETDAWGTSTAVVMETSEIAVSQKNITLAAINSKTEYLVGDEFVAPTKVVIIKNDGTTEEVTGVTITGYDMTTEGTQTVTVWYDNLSTKYPITVKTENVEPPVAPEVVLESIAVSGQRTEYTVGDEFVKPTVTATYSDGSTKDVTEDATFTGYDMSVAGTQTVTVVYQGLTTKYQISVAKEPEIEGDWAVSATFDDDATVQFAIDAFNARWNGQTSADKVRKVDAIGQGINGTDAVGLEYARTGQWGGVQQVTTPSTVDWSKVKYISFYARIIPTTEGTTSNKFAMRVNGPNYYCSFDATTEWQFFEFNLTEVDLSGVPTSYQLQWTQNNVGAGKLIIDNLTFSNCSITPIATLLQTIAVSGQKTEYTVGDEFVKPTVTATYTDGSTKVVTADATFTGYDMSVVGTQTVTASYQGFTATYVITVKNAAVPFSTTTKSGYYSQDKDSTDKSGIIAYNSVINNFDSYKDVVESFGFYLYLSGADESQRVSVVASNIEDLIANSGKFNTAVRNIPESEFATVIIAMPYVVIDGEIYSGNAVSATVDANNWLGAK